MAKKQIKVAVIGHRSDSKRARAHALIMKHGGKKADKAKVIPLIRKLGVKPATATSWFYDMRRAKPSAQKAAAH